MDRDTDVLVIGAGIAGASVGFFLAPRCRVVLLEAESQPGYHSTGRSAAMFMESYGTSAVRALTRASRAFYETPPSGFASAPLLTLRGALYVAGADQLAQLETTDAELRPHTPGLQRLDTREVLERVPAMRAGAVAAGLLDPGAADIDVHALHQGFLRGARAAAATLVTDARVLALQPNGDGWHVETAQGRWQARSVVNAAGAWADVVAALAGIAPIGLQPKRRSAFLFDPPPRLPIAAWPCVAGIDESWYFKPDADRLFGSPANTDPVPPHDVQPEEIDIATGIARIEAMTTLQVRRPSHTWAGLRSFVSDGDLVAGIDPFAPGFFWLAAQGGYGIQTAPAMGALCAARLLGEPMPAECGRAGVDWSHLAVDRLHRRPTHTITSSEGDNP
jgi:D-arginine dehydrogenase